MYRGKRAKRRRLTAPLQAAEKSKKSLLRNDIKLWRIRKELTQQELADMVGVSRVTISYWETNTKCPTDKYKLALCKALNCTLSDLFRLEV